MGLPPVPAPAALSGSSFLILGLGRSGQAAASALLAAGAAVHGYEERREMLETSAIAGLVRRGLRLTADPTQLNVDLAVVSPGWSDRHPLLRELKRRGAGIADELDLAARFVPGPVIAVTGTNGKSTTTALIAAMLSSSGCRVFCGGNIAPGKPLSAALNRKPYDWYVVEVSSFQLERSRWLAPHIALILNITADHLNRHGSMAEYARCKYRLLERQGREDSAILGWDDPRARAAARFGAARKYWFSAHRKVRGGYVNGGWFCFDGTPVAPLKLSRLPGSHNRLNVLAAISAACLAGARPAAIRRGLAGFAGLPHRLQQVRTLRGVTFVNNSMCTNPAAGARSLEAYPRAPIVIAGGQEKGLPTAVYVDAMVRRARRVVLIGESARAIGRALSRRGFDRFETAATLGDAVRAAARQARRGDVVLFSPGFASFDMFRDFQDRGRRFTREVRRLQ